MDDLHQEVIRLRDTLRMWRIVLSQVPGVTVSAWGVDGRCIVASIPQYAELGYDESYVFEGKTMEESVPPERLPRLQWFFERARIGEKTVGEYPVSDTLLMELTAVPVRVKGEVIAVIFHTRDITAERAADSARRAAGGIDSLTALPRRGVLAAHVSGLIRHRAPFALLFIDLDNFKSVNDTMGHRAGDALLTRVAVQLRAAIRSGDLAVRLGGDEFVVVMANVDRADEAAARVLKSVLGVTGPFGSGASVGLAVYPDDGESVDDLLGSADRAMYRAKQAGGDAIRRSQ